MKIVVVIPSLNKGGAERVVSVLSKEWVKKNEVKIIVFNGSNLSYSFGGDIIDLNLPAQGGIFPKILQFIRRSIKIVRILRRENPDYIISFMESANLPSILSAYFTGKLNKLTVSVHAGSASMLKLYNILIPYLYRYPHQIIVVSKGIFTTLIKMGVPKKKIKIINNPLPASAPVISKPLPRPNDTLKNYILGVGRLDKNKGFDLLIEAFSNIPDKNMHLVILGEGPERKKLESIISNKNLSDRIHLYGLVNDIWPWYRHSKCFVSSSLMESWGNSIVEAMSQGCPVVAFDCDYGPREIITDGLNGLLVTINDVQSLTNNITVLLSDNLLRNKICHNGLTRSSEFNSRKLSAQWLS